MSFATLRANFACKICLNKKKIEILIPLDPVGKAGQGKRSVVMVVSLLFVAFIM